MEDFCPMFLALMQLGEPRFMLGALKRLLMLAVPLILLAFIIALRLRQSIHRHSERLGRKTARTDSDGRSFLARLCSELEQSATESHLGGNQTCMTGGRVNQIMLFSTPAVT